MGSPQLSAGWLLAVRSGENAPPGYVQLLEIKHSVQSAQNRSKICVNDGQHKGYLLLPSQFNDEINNPQKYPIGTILHVTQVQNIVSNNKRVIIIYAMEPVGHVPNIIGNPTELPKEGENGDAAPGGPPGPNGAPGSMPHMQGPGPNYGQPPHMKQEPGPGAPYGQQPPGGMYPLGSNGGQQQYPGSLPAAGPGPSYGGPSHQGGGGPPGSFVGNGGPPPVHGGVMGFGGVPVQAGPGPAYGAGAGGGAQGSRPPLGYGGGAGPGAVMGSRGPGPSYNMQPGGPVARNAAPPSLTPIRALNPYLSRWTIKGRCTAKSDIKRFNNARSDGKFFSFDLLDKEGGEVRIVAFNEQADKYLNMIQIGNVYTLTKANVVQKKPQFNNTNHNFEVRLERDSHIEQVPEDEETAIIPRIQYNFCRIEDLEGKPIGAIVDIIGILETVHDWTTITRKTGEETRKRGIVLRDDSHRSIEVTLWGSFTENPGNDLEQAFKSGHHPVVAVKGGRLGEFQGRNLSTIGSTQVNVDPQIDAAMRLRQWYDQVGHSSAVTAMSGGGAGGGGGGGGASGFGARDQRRTTFKAVKDEGLGQQGKPEWANVNAVVNYIRHPSETQPNATVVYPSCPGVFNNRQCQKKLEDQGNGEWMCSRCGPIQEPNYRYLVSFSAMDHTGVQWITAFGDQADPLFGFPASHYYQMKLQDEKFESRIPDLYNFQNMILRIKVAEETWNEEQRIKYNIQKFEPVDFSKEGRILFDGIHKLDMGLPVLQAREGPAPTAQPAAGQGGGGHGPPHGQPPQQWGAGPTQAQGQHHHQQHGPPQGYQQSANPFNNSGTQAYQQGPPAGAFNSGGPPQHQQPMHGGYNAGPSMGGAGYGGHSPGGGPYAPAGGGYPGPAQQGGGPPYGGGPQVGPMQQPGGQGPPPYGGQQYPPQQGGMPPQYQQQQQQQQGPPGQQPYMGGPPPPQQQQPHGGMYHQGPPPQQQQQQGYPQYPPQQQQGAGAGQPYF